MNLAVFAYNFPHKKTQDFLFKLFMEEIRPVVVLAMDYIDLAIPQPTLRVKPKHISLLHPQKICRVMNLPYYVVDHNSKKCKDLLQSYNVDMGLITGSRILKLEIINSVSKGIINFHPGLIPDVRGLDALQWAIYEDHPIGVTSHIIDWRVDAGRIIEKAVIDEHEDDSLIDLSIRLHETQLNMLVSTLESVNNNPVENFQFVESSHLHRKMPPELETTIPSLLAKRLAR